MSCSGPKLADYELLHAPAKIALLLRNELILIARESCEIFFCLVGTVNQESASIYPGQTSNRVAE